MSLEENPYADAYNFCCPPKCPPSTTQTGGGGGNGDTTVTQPNHGFIFGNVLKCIGVDTYALAMADTAANCEVVGAVNSVIDVNTFTIRHIGNMDGFAGLIPATTYFLSDTVAGTLSPIEPGAGGSISKPLLIAHSTGSGFFFNFRGIEPGTPGGIGAITVSVAGMGDFPAGEAFVSPVGTIAFNQDQFKIHDNGSGQVQVELETSIAPVFGDLTDSGVDGITITGGMGAVAGLGTSLSQHVADSTHNGYLSLTDWNTFNSKQNALTFGNLTDVGTDGITITGGTGAVIGSGTVLSQHVADATHNGYLSSADWLAFTAATSPAAQDRTVTLFANGSGSVLASGTKEPIKATFGGTLQGWTMMCVPSGSVTVDILRAVDGAGLPVTSIVGGGTKPSISSNVENSGTNFSGWTSAAITAKDNLAISLSGITNATYCEITLHYK